MALSFFIINTFDLLQLIPGFHLQEYFLFIYSYLKSIIPVKHRIYQKNIKALSLKQLLFERY
jgi:hypothetical protein